MSALLRAFQEEAGTAAGLAGRDGAALARLLASLYARGRLAHPGIDVSEQDFGRTLARARGVGAGRTASLAEVPAEDLYLACACAAGVSGAAAAFEEKLGRVIRRAVSRVLATPDERQEAEHRAWRHLLDGGDGPPRLAFYRGQAPLEKWVSVASMRVAIAFGRSENAERRLRELAMAEAAGVDHQALLKQGELHEAFEAAVSEALARIPGRERLILKLYLVSGMTLEAIGNSVGFTRQAVAKMIDRARESIVADVEAAVQQRLELSKDDLASILRYVASQLDVSISRVLAKP